MSQAEELLNSLSEEGAMTYTANSKTEPHIVIGPDRKIAIPQELKRLGVQWDHNIETVTFDCPRYWDEHDMSKMKVYINYIRADKKPGSWPVDNGVTVDETDDSIMHFNWTITRELTEAKGNIIFLVCIKSVDADGNENEHWNSELCTDAYISEGLETMETVISKYPDIITHLLTRMDIVEEKTTLQSMLGYLDTYFTTDAKINEVLQNYVTEYLDESSEVRATIEQFVNDYIQEHLAVTDTTLTLEGGVADAAATGDAVRNMVNVTNETNVNDSVEGVLNIKKLFGRSEQLKTTGAQLIDTDAFTSAIEATFTVNDNVITVTGIKPYAGARYIIPNPTAYAGKYLTLSCKSISKSLANEGHCIAQIAIQKVEGSTEYFSVNASRLVNTFKIAEDVSIITLQIMANNSTASLSTSNTVTVVDLILNIGETALPWEPYTGGMAAPNPEYPQEIKSAGNKGSIIGAIASKNLFDKTKYVFIDGKTLDTATGGLKDTTGNGWMSFDNYIPIKPSTDYIMSGDVVPTSWTSTIAFYDSDKNFLGVTKCTNSGSKTYRFTSTNKAAYMRFSVHASAVNIGTIQIEVGSTVTDYVAGDTKDISIQTPNGLPGIEVTDASLANYIDPDGKMWVCDEIDFERGVYVKRVGKTTFDLTNQSATAPTHYHTTLDAGKYMVDGPVICDKLLAGNKEGGYIYINANNTIRVNIDCNTIDEANERLGLVTMYGVLATPIETPLTHDQINAVRNYQSHNGGTNVIFEPIVPGVEMEYPRTLAASYIMEAQQDIEQLQQSVRRVPTDSEIVIEDSVAGPLAMRQLYGKSSQRTLIGKNLLNNTAKSETRDGITFTVNEDGSVTVNGTATANVQIYPTNNAGLESGEYIISGGLSNNKRVFFYDGTKYYNAQPDETKFVVDETTKQQNVALVIIEGEVCNNETFYPMIRKASIIDDTYEPYCGGIPSPNPEYPQPIVSVGQKLALGNQLFDVDAETLNAVINNSVLFGNTSYRAYIIPVKNGNAYVLSKVNDGKYAYIGFSSTIPTVGTTLTNTQSIGSMTKVEFTASDNYLCMMFHVDSDLSAVMLNAGTTALPREPYTGGVKKAVDVGIEHKTTGKNLLDVNATTGLLLGYSDTNAESLSGVWLTTDYIEVIKKVVTISVNNVTDNFVVRFNEYDSDRKCVAYHGNAVGVNGNSSATLTLLDETKYVRLTFGFNNKACTPESYIESGNTIQLEYGTVATPYEPYHSSSALLAKTLPGIPVTDAALANYTDENGQMWCSDEIDFERGVYVKRIGKVVFDGSDDEGWSAGNTGISDKYRLIGYSTVGVVQNNIANDNCPNILCTHYGVISPNDTYGAITGISLGTGGHIQIYDEDFNTSDVSLWKAHLAENPITVLYELATPIETPLTAEEMEAYRNLRTYDGYTKLSNDSGAGVVMEYPTSRTAAIAMEADIKAERVDDRVDVFAGDLENLEEIVAGHFKAIICGPKNDYTSCDDLPANSVAWVYYNAVNSPDTKGSCAVFTLSGLGTTYRVQFACNPSGVFKVRASGTSGWSNWEAKANASEFDKYLPLAGGALTGGLQVPSVGTSGYHPYVSGGKAFVSSSKTGYLKIKLPVSFNSTIFRFTVSIYDYVNNVIVDYVVSGYNYQSSNSWERCKVYSLGDIKDDLSNLPVGFGHDGEKCAIYIGTESTPWGYVQIAIHDVIGGYNGYTYDSWKEGWLIDIIPALDGDITGSVNNPNIIASAFTVSGDTIIYNFL